jgi:hypothetical protein
VIEVFEGDHHGENVGEEGGKMQLRMCERKEVEGRRKRDCFGVEDGVMMALIFWLFERVWGMRRL